MKNRVRSWVAALLFCGTACFAAPVQIDFFYEPGCRTCEQIEQEILPEIGKRFPDTCEIRRHDIGIETNFLTLLKLENALGYDGAERGYLVVGGRRVFGPSPDVETLCAAISGLADQPAASAGEEPQPDALLAQRFHGFTLPAVLLAGLLDGINPCAISTLVFFMSLLAVSRVRNRQLILLGISFCTASFLTYLALGFGLFRVLHLFAGFTVLRRAVEAVFAAVLLIFAALSFRDAIRFKKTGRAADVTLQLSAGMKQRIHGVMRRGLGSRSVVLGGLMTGTAVTALESVCTGQVYVPTLVLILKESAFSGLRAWMLLLAYNLMFILPLAAVFAAVYFGLKTDTLLRWSRRNVVVSKTLLGLLFILIALLIMWF